MNNLKRVLSLALSGIMLVGMMAIGASAADFSDADEIQHTDAVNVLVALNVINGKDDGSFDPTGNVTRGQMAKMIAVAMNGGTDTNTGVKATPTFTDIKGHWAESYIEYCADLNIISGRGDGTFDPDGDVTGLEATKMVLTALGYDSTAYRLTGASWAVRTDELARAANPNLYDDLTGTVMSNKASRDVAAQLIWNGLQNTTRRVTPNTNTNTGEVTWTYGVSDKTMLEERYDAEIKVGVFTGNDKINSSAEDGQIVVSTEDVDYFVPSDLDISFIGEEVKVIYKNGKKSTSAGPDKNDTIYGVFVTGNTQVVNSTMGKVADNKASETKIKVDGVKYSLADTVEVIFNYNEEDVDSKSYTDAALKGNSSTNSALTTDLKKPNGNTIKLLLDDNKVTRIYVTEYALAKVTAKNSEKVSFNNSFGAVDIEDNDLYEGIAKNDVVVISRLYNSAADKGYTIAKKAEVVTGTVNGFKDTESVTVDGTVYKIYNKVDTLEAVKDTAIEKFADKHIGEDFDLYMVNGYVAGAVQTSESFSNYSLVIDVSNTGSVGSVLNGLKIQVLSADGTKTILTVNDDSVDKTFAANPDGSYPTIDQSSHKIEEGDIVTFSVDKNGEATVELVGKTESASSNAGYVAKTKSFDGTTIASEAVFFANTSADGTSYKAYDLRALGDITVEDDMDLTVVEDGDEVVAVYVDLGKKPAGATTTTVYGIISAYNGSVKVNGDAYKSYTVDVNDEQHTVYSNVSGLAKGKIVELDLTSDNIYTRDELKLVSPQTPDAIGYVSKYSDRDSTVTVGTTVTAETVNGSTTYKVTGDTTVFAIDGNTKIYYVDQDNDKGVISSISEFDAISGTKNIIVFADDDNVAETIIFEVSNEVDILG